MQGTNYDARYPYMILLGFFVVGSGLMLLLPETLHQKLPETIREAEKFGKNQPFWFLPKRVHKPSTEEEKFVEKDSDLLEKLNQPQFTS